MKTGRWLSLLAACILTWPATDLAGEDPIRRLLGEQVAAWNAGDARAWGKDLVQDVDFINILGMHFQGRQATVQRHAELFDTLFKGSRLSMEVDRIRFLGDSAAIVTTTLKLTGYQHLPPGIHPSSDDDMLRTRMTYALVRNGDGWHIVSVQNTAIMPMDRGHTPPHGS